MTQYICKGRTICSRRGGTKRGNKSRRFKKTVRRKRLGRFEAKLLKAGNLKKVLAGQHETVLKNSGTLALKNF